MTLYFLSYIMNILAYFSQVPTEQLLNISKIKNYSISNHHQIFWVFSLFLGLVTIARGVTFYNINEYYVDNDMDVKIQ